MLTQIEYLSEGMMRIATTKADSTSSFTPMRSPLLQRQCACGNSAGLTASCDECQKKALTLQRRSTEQTEASTRAPDRA
ncbi:MAG: hypothetical protein HC881_13365 [Leptolyngbyaceae cyanobacterium SL_7_1]|nr:hypothetical protein [Leptolyngbyaceae cyanobacterium SL_7_1]